jgi:hypothetical protein
LASEATVYIMLEDVNDEIPLFTEREQETVLEGEPIGTKVTQVNAIDKDGTFPNNLTKIVPIKVLSIREKFSPWNELHFPKNYHFCEAFIKLFLLKVSIYLKHVPVIKFIEVALGKI